MFWNDVKWDGHTTSWIYWKLLNCTPQEDEFYYVSYTSIFKNATVKKSNNSIRNWEKIWRDKSAQGRHRWCISTWRNSMPLAIREMQMKPKIKNKDNTYCWWRWSKTESLTLRWWEWKTTAPLEDSFFRKQTCCWHMTQQLHFCAIIPEKRKSCSHKNLCVNMYSSLIHHSPKVETSQMSFSGWVTWTPWNTTHQWKERNC